MPFSVPTFRYSSPGMIAGKLPMSPLRTSQEINLGGLKKGLGCGMGAFFGKREARIWKEDLKKTFVPKAKFRLPLSSMGGGGLRP